MKKNYYFLYLLFICISVPCLLRAQEGKPSAGLLAGFDSLGQQMSEAGKMINTFGDQIEITSLNNVKARDEYNSALTKVKAGKWKDANERFFAENVLLPVFSGRKDLLNAMSRVAKTNQINVMGIRSKMLNEVLKYDISLLITELAPKYVAKLQENKKAPEGGSTVTTPTPGTATGKPQEPKMTAQEAEEAKTQALELASSRLEAFMQKYNDGNPKLSVDQWKMLWNQIRTVKGNKEVVTRGQKALKDHPQLIESEKWGSNMRNALEALAHLDK